MSVYFITCRDVNMVKVGYSDRVRSRLCGIQVCCPLDVKLQRSNRTTHRPQPSPTD